MTPVQEEKVMYMYRKLKVYAKVHSMAKLVMKDRFLHRILDEWFRIEYWILKTGHSLNEALEE